MSSAVVCVGLTTLDLTYSGVDGPFYGTKVQASSYEISVGGPAANAAIAAAMLGSTVSLASSSGTGPLRDVVSKELDEVGVRPIESRPHAPLPVSTVIIGDGGERSVISTNGGFATPQASIDLTRDSSLARAVLADGHYPSLAKPALSAARNAGVPTAIDLGSWKPGLPGLLPYCDIAIASEDFVMPKQRRISDLFDVGVTFIVTTRGREDILWWDADGSEGSVRVPQVAEVATNGAGDVLHGAFVHFLASGVDRIKALKQAAEIASLSCTHIPARIPDSYLADFADAREGSP